MMLPPAPDPVHGFEVRSPWRSTDAVVLEVVGEVDLLTAASLLEAVENELAVGRRVLVLDLAGVSFCSARCLGALLEIRRIAHRHGSAVHVVRPSRQVRRVAQLAGCRDVLDEDDRVT